MLSVLDELVPLQYISAFKPLIIIILMPKLKAFPIWNELSFESGIFTILQDNHFSGAENENERKPESTPLPNKHLPSSKKSGARVEVRFVDYIMNLDENKSFL